MTKETEALKLAHIALENLEHSNFKRRRLDALIAIKQALAQPEQERPWVGLTEGERVDILDAELTAQSTEHFALAQAIEAKLKEKNT
jgi:hypothetical protein